jgi:hypothetical protein
MLGELSVREVGIFKLCRPSRRAQQSELDWVGTHKSLSSQGGWTQIIRGTRSFGFTRVPYKGPSQDRYLELRH